MVEHILLKGRDACRPLGELCFQDFELETPCLSLPFLCFESHVGMVSLSRDVRDIQMQLVFEEVGEYWSYPEINSTRR